MLHTEAAWAEAEGKWGFEVAVLEYDLRSGGRHFPRHLASNPAWALVYWDDHSAVYLKRIPRFAALIERYGYRLARPNFYGFGYLKELTALLPPAQALALAQTDVQRNPGNQEPRLALVYLLYTLDRRGYGAAIERELQTCLTLQPDLAQEHAALGMLYLESGRREGALREARLALALDPNDPGAKFLQGKLGL
jgi:tetratricopeptide (TPR) repeat protein